MCIKNERRDSRPSGSEQEAHFTESSQNRTEEPRVRPAVGRGGWIETLLGETSRRAVVLAWGRGGEGLQMSRRPLGE